ncbi:MAG: hypothetical protein ACI9RL_001427 [Candidatus Paceibacteria bacterium]|jgi:hypothetical protein
MNLTFQKISILVLLTVMYGCDSPPFGDCFQAAGTSISMIVDVEPFSKVRIEGEVTLFIKQGDVQEVALTTGDNLLSDVSVFLVEDTLVITDTNACNFVREYGITVVTITTPNLTAIRNASNFDVTGIGTLAFPELLLTSNTTQGPGGIETIKKSGDFYLDIICDDFNISANGKSIFYISGAANKASVNFSNENPRFEGRNFLVNEFNVFHRSSNKMIVNPQEKLTGILLSTGDLISVNKPPFVDVDVMFTGQLIFE